MGQRRTKSFGLYVGTEATPEAKVRVKDSNLVINELPPMVWRPTEWEASRAGYNPKPGGAGVWEAFRPAAGPVHVGALRGRLG